MFRKMTMMFFLLMIFNISSFKLSHSTKNTTFACPEIEKQALLSLKQSVKDPYQQLSSWNSLVDCCTWEHVVCDNMTGHVSELDQSYLGLGGELNPSLINLKHMRYLDLKGNTFQGLIPSFIGSFSRLEFLDLSNAGFHGAIPHSIGNLSSLRNLSLGGDLLHCDQSIGWLSGLSRLEYLNMNFVNLRTVSDWVQVINSLPSLVELHFSVCSLNFFAFNYDDEVKNNTSNSLAILDLSYNFVNSLDLINVDNVTLYSPFIPKWIFQLGTLTYLDLKGNGFQGQIPNRANFTNKLQYLDFSINYFNSTIPDWLYLCNNLESIASSYSFLTGRVSSGVGNLTSLRTLDLSLNDLSGEIPREIASLCRLKSLNLERNKLQGEIFPHVFGNMSDCFAGALEDLNLRENKFSGHLTSRLGEFKILQTLNLGQNSFSGQIPSSIGKLSSSLEDLRLDSNKFSSSLPESLGELYTLQFLYINDNNLEGIVSENHFANLTNLFHFSASRNHLTLKVDPNWNPSFQIQVLGLGSWGIGAKIPTWLETQRNSLSDLDLSSTGISGNIPTWFWNIHLSLNLSHNKFQGEFPPDLVIATDSVFLSSNRFNGSLPKIESSLEELDLSDNAFSGGLSHFLCNINISNTDENNTYAMRILHLGGNLLSGEIPDCWRKWPSLNVLNLGNNNFSGRIPASIGALVDLRSLNVKNNSLFGRIPSSMRNCTKLVKIELISNRFTGNIPSWIGSSLTNLRFLILRSNEFTGEIPPSICRLKTLQILDLSDNKFSGTIPKCVGNFTAMATGTSRQEMYREYSFQVFYIRWLSFDSTSVHTKGSELEYDTIMSLVTNIDLSGNNFSGEIPEELTCLVELRSLNLSGNHLTGRIPDKIGDMKQLESLDLSRNYISGEIPNSFSVLSSLNYLNLSYNNLTGKIPVSTQLQSLPASSFTGNQGLCGPPLTSNCSRIPVAASGEGNGDGGVDESGIDWFYIFLSLGYAMGFSVICTTLFLKRSWRNAYFGFWEDVWNKFCVFVKLRFRNAI